MVRILAALAALTAVGLQSVVAFSISSYRGDCQTLNFTLELTAAEFTAADAYQVSITTPGGENRNSLFDFIGPDPFDPLFTSTNLETPLTVTWARPLTTGGNSTWQFALYNDSKLINYPNRTFQDTVTFMWPIYCGTYTSSAVSTSVAASTTTGGSIPTIPVTTTSASASASVSTSTSTNGGGGGNNGNSNGSNNGNSNGGNAAQEEDGGGGSNTGAIVGGVVGGVVGLGALALLGFCLFRRRRNKETTGTTAQEQGHAYAYHDSGPPQGGGAGGPQPHWQAGPPVAGAAFGGGPAATAYQPPYQQSVQAPLPPSHTASMYSPVSSASVVGGGGPGFSGYASPAQPFAGATSGNPLLYAATAGGAAGSFVAGAGAGAHSAPDDGLPAYDAGEARAVAPEKAQHVHTPLGPTVQGTASSTAGPSSSQPTTSAEAASATGPPTSDVTRVD